MLPGMIPTVLSSTAARSFSISPAVSGKTIWNLDIDGPLVLSTPGAYTLTPNVGFRGTVKLWGGGGGGCSGAAVVGTDGGNTTAFGMSAGGGKKAPTFAFGSTVQGSPGTGGTASGGDINTNGPSGSSKTGGTSPNGGTGGTGGALFSVTPGSNGNPPGGGGGGGSYYDGTFVGQGGGGGAGAYVQKLMMPGAVTPGTPYSLVVGAKGNGGQQPSTAWRGGNGGDGRITIE